MVDEYGVVVGLITTDDILEGIVGEFIVEAPDSEDGGISLVDGNTYRATGNTLLHGINHVTKWNLSEDGPRTLNGWVLDHLRCVPSSQTSVNIESFQVEILEVSDNAIKSAYIVNQSLDDDFGVTKPALQRANESEAD